MSSIMKGLVDEQDIEETKKLSAQEKFKRSMARAGYDMDAGAKRLQDLLDKQKKEREEFAKKEKEIKEDETLQYAAEVTPKVSPYAGVKDRKFRGPIGEAVKKLVENPNESPTDAGYQEGGWRKMNEEELDEDLRKWFKEKWVRFGPDGKIRGACARGSSSEGKPKCLPQAKAHALGKKGRKYAAAKKRREDPNPERSGPAKNVATKKKSNEAANPAQQAAIAINMKKLGKKPKSESINEGLWDWIKDKLSNKKPIQWSENYYDFIIRNDPTYLQTYLNAVKNDPNYIEWKKNNPNKPQQSTSQTNYASSQNRPNQSGSFDDFTAPHGSSENEFKMFVNGQKPAAIVPEPNFSTWAKVINSGKYWTKQLFYNGRLHSVIIVQPGNEQSGQQIYELVQNAMKLAEKGDFRAYNNSNYHRRLGKLLGYPKDKVEQFINNYFKDREDLAKIKIDEQGVAEGLNEFKEKPEEGPGSDDYEELLFNLAYHYWEGDSAGFGAERKLSLLGWKPEYGDDYTAIELYKIGTDGSDENFRSYTIDEFEDFEQRMNGSQKGITEGYSDMSGLLSASNLNNSYIITAELAEGGKKKFRVKAQSERVAIEKFKKHHSMAKIINVEEEGVKEGSKYPRNPASYHLKKYPVPQDQMAKPVKKEPKKPEKKPYEKLDELKCWPGYSRVKGVPAGAPGSCKKKTNEYKQLGNTEWEKKRILLAQIKRFKENGMLRAAEDAIKTYKLLFPQDKVSERESCPECGGAMYEASLMNEKKDACYYKVKSRYKVWPSAYASGALVKCRKKGAKNWGTKSEGVEEGQIYSTGGGAGEAQRYFTPKSSSIYEGISKVTENVKPVDPIHKIQRDKPHQQQVYLSKSKKKPEPAAKINFAHELEKYKRLPEGTDQEFHTGGSPGLPYPSTYEQEYDPFKRKGQRRITAMTNEDMSMRDLPSLVVNFYKSVPKFSKKPVQNYDELSQEYLNKADRKLQGKLKKIIDIGKANPYLQGGIITTVGALLAGGILSIGNKYGLSPTQTNILLQGILNTVIPTLVSRINGRNWIDTIKYTLASAGTGVGIASLTEKWSEKYKRSINCSNPKGFSQRAHCQGRKKK